MRKKEELPTNVFREIRSASGNMLSTTSAWGSRGQRAGTVQHYTMWCAVVIQGEPQLRHDQHMMAPCLGKAIYL
eukprot:7508005-Pyramimonas_sp.AAC.1